MLGGFTTFSALAVDTAVLAGRGQPVEAAAVLRRHGARRARGGRRGLADRRHAVTAPLLVLVALAGGAGATVRFLLDRAIRARASTAFPLGTVLINCTGSLLLGLIVGLAGRAVLPEAVHLIAGTGFLGGYTTFSAASVETLALLTGRRGGLALVNGLVVPVVTVLLAAGRPRGRRNGVNRT